MAKAKNSRMYLKILGTVLMVLSILGLICAVALFFIDASDLNLVELGVGDTLAQLQANFDDTTVKNIIAASLVLATFVDFLVAWAIRRAGTNPKGKTTIALVLIILECISSAYSLFTAGFSAIGIALSNIVVLTIYVLALMAILNVRKETGE